MLFGEPFPFGDECALPLETVVAFAYELYIFPDEFYPIFSNDFFARSVSRGKGDDVFFKRIFSNDGFRRFDSGKIYAVSVFFHCERRAFAETEPAALDVFLSYLFRNVNISLVVGKFLLRFFHLFFRFVFNDSFILFHIFLLLNIGRDLHFFNAIVFSRFRTLAFRHKSYNEQNQCDGDEYEDYRL